MAWDIEDETFSFVSTEEVCEIANELMALPTVEDGIYAREDIAAALVTLAAHYS